MAYDEKTAERIREILGRSATEKKLMGGLCFMVKGGMCCSVSGKGGLLVRIDADAHERTLREPHVGPVEMGRRTVTGFVRVAPEGYRTAAMLQKWIERGLAAATARSAIPSAGKRRGPAQRKRRAGRSKPSE
jgi:hypothetical protein